MGCTCPPVNPGRSVCVLVAVSPLDLEARVLVIVAVAVRLRLAPWPTLHNKASVQASLKDARACFLSLSSAMSFSLCICLRALTLLPLVAHLVRCWWVAMCNQVLVWGVGRTLPLPLLRVGEAAFCVLPTPEACDAVVEPFTGMPLPLDQTHANDGGT